MRKNKSTLLIIKGVIILGLFTSLADAAESAKIVNKANSLYQRQKYAEALKLYNEAFVGEKDLPALNFNRGAAQFKTGNYELALGSFEKGLVSENRDLESWSNYNTANSKYEIGKLKANKDLSAAVKLLEESLGYYKRTIDLNSKDEDAKFNYELVEKELKALKEKLKQQEKENQKQEGQGKKEQEKDSEKQKSQKQEDKFGQGQPEQKEQKQAPQEDSQAKQNESKQEEKSGQKGELKEMLPQEAKMLLDGYRQEEERPFGLIDDKRKGSSDEVSKDW